ncbi:helix-turn-helix domain-containing protein [Streptomyces sp. SID7813]|uniref:DNA-binding protein n=2 Tax=Streptomyces TaxID=1883 RepID=Q9X8E5_STRCO|nr:DNA-binding protein [Streptomyces lividans TK24]KKD13901.1 XRE family transcriptional regulator [Streptomyces sp. WM6391]MYU42795.1 helix-turn-helix domain-containing protein [Streptomyces sp. SID7813]QFI47793.1 helix-turn-helix transcriptional regulator [Streptomyces coelicolor A3(2)]THA87209.1 XRE family transcriptional regulator [Streptomyces sp. LRa12]
MREAAEIECAHQVQKVCEAQQGHGAHLRAAQGELMNHSTWRTRRTGRLEGEAVEYDQEYVDARLAGDLGQAVYDRRIELGLSRTELAERAGMTQPQVSRMEGATLCRRSRCCGAWPRPWTAH